MEIRAPKRAIRTYTCVDGFTEEHYEGFIRDWEARLNHFLATGEMLT